MRAPLSAVSIHKSYEWNNDFRSFGFNKTGFILVIINLIFFYSLAFQPWGLMDTQWKLYIIVSYGKKSSSNFSFLQHNNENIFAYGLPSGSVAGFWQCSRSGRQSKRDKCIRPLSCLHYNRVEILRAMTDVQFMACLCRSTTIACLSRSVR